MLTRLSLSHFRSHRQTRLTFDGRPVVFHGPNGAGKTNVLEALSLLSPGRGLRRAAPVDLVRRPEGLGWKIGADLDGHEVEAQGTVEGVRATRIDGKAVPQLALSRIARVLWLVPAMDRLWIDGAEGRRRFLDRSALSLFPTHGEAVLAYEKAMRDRNRLLKDDVRDPGWYAALEARMAEAAEEIGANRRATVERLAAGQEDEGFPVASLSIDGQDDVAPGEDLALALARGRERDRAAGRTLLGPHRADLAARYAAKDQPADLCSTGEQKALLISLVLANVRAVRADTGAAPLLLLDEVAAHLDGARAALLFDALCAMGAQAFLTGTGPEAFTSLGARAQRFRVTDAQGVTEVEEDP